MSVFVIGLLCALGGFIVGGGVSAVVAAMFLKDFDNFWQ